MKPYLLIFHLLLSSILLASDNSHSLFYSQSSAGTGFFSLNPAGKSKLNKATFGVLAENRFGLKELNTGVVSAVFSSRIGSLGVAVSNYGDELYGQNIFGANYSRSLSPSFDLGIEANYLSTHFEQESISHFFVVFGMQAQLSHSWRWGVYIANLNRAYFEEEALPIVFSSGVAYGVSDKVQLFADILKETNFPLEAKVGIEYFPVPSLSVSAEVKSYSQKSSFSIGYQLASFFIEMSNTFHGNLGSSPRFSIIYEL
jgi:hypothetical protein